MQYHNKRKQEAMIKQVKVGVGCALSALVLLLGWMCYDRVMTTETTTLLNVNAQDYKNILSQEIPTNVLDGAKEAIKNIEK